jgi:hypothetical protein
MLMSDATFGRGDGVAGLLDIEVEHDVYGLPYMRGRTLKGLLVEECANVLYALQQTSCSQTLAQCATMARLLFGHPGSTLADGALMRVGAAMLPRVLREAVAHEIDTARLTPEDVLASLTAIRRQTAVNEETHAPEKNSLRSLRVVLRNTTFIAELECAPQVDCEAAKALLAATVLALRRAGTGRNRGRGRLQAKLYDSQGYEVTTAWFAHLTEMLHAEAATRGTAV